MHPAKLTLIKNVLNLRALRILIIFTPTIIHSYRSKGSWRFDSCVSFRVLVGAVWKGDVSPRGVQTSQVPIFPRVCLLWCRVINVINALLLTHDCISPICISRATYPQNWNQLLRDRKGIGIPFCAVTKNVAATLSEENTTKISKSMAAQWKRFVSAPNAPFPQPLASFPSGPLGMDMQSSTFAVGKGKKTWKFFLCCLMFFQCTVTVFCCLAGCPKLLWIQSGKHYLLW